MLPNGSELLAVYNSKIYSKNQCGSKNKVSKTVIYDLNIDMLKRLLTLQSEEGLKVFFTPYFLRYVVV
jgi:hypothetical protein